MDVHNKELHTQTIGFRCLEQCVQRFDSEIIGSRYSFCLTGITTPVALISPQLQCYGDMVGVVAW
jgi:hypothetical protein